MIPIIARSAEVVLLLVPVGLREAGLALGVVAVADRATRRAADGQGRPGVRR